MRTLRQAGGWVGGIFSTAATDCAISATRKPVRPSCITALTEPQLKAIVGVPQAMASIMVRPKGAGQSMGKRYA